MYPVFLSANGKFLQVPVFIVGEILLGPQTTPISIKRIRNSMT